MRTHNKEDRTSNSLKVEHCHWNHILRTSYGSGSHLRADSQVKDSYCAAHFHSLTPGQGHFFPLKLYNCDLFASWDQKCSKITFFFLSGTEESSFQKKPSHRLSHSKLAFGLGPWFQKSVIILGPDYWLKAGGRGSKTRSQNFTPPNTPDHHHHPKKHF